MLNDRRDPQSSSTVLRVEESQLVEIHCVSSDNGSIIGRQQPPSLSGTVSKLSNGSCWKQLKVVVLQNC